MFEDQDIPKSREELLRATPSEVLESAKCRLESPHLMDSIVEHIQCLGVAGEQALIATLYLVGTSRLLLRPLATIVQGPSSSGKSYLIDKVSSLFPPEAVLVVTDMTPNSLYYLPEGSLRHRFLCCGERGRKQNEETAGATKALREMVSNGFLVKCVTVLNPFTGMMETREIRQQGPIAYVESTTAAEIYEEDRNRCILLQTDERPEQTDRIVSEIARRAQGCVTGNSIETIIAWHWAMQRLIEPRSVVIPYAVELGRHFRKDRVEARREFPQLQGMICASALLHQFQRESTAEGWIIATRDDYAIARQLMARPLSLSLGGAPSDALVRFHNRLLGLPDQEWTAPQLARAFSVEVRTVNDYLRALQDYDAAERIEAGRGSKPAKWVVCRGVDLECIANSVLPSVEDLFGSSASPADT